MPTYRTGNPIGTASAKDLYDDAQDLDNLLTGPELSYPNRLGKKLISYIGILKKVNDLIAESQEKLEQQLLSFGVKIIGDYSEGIQTFNGYNEVITYNGSYFKVKTSVSLPFVTSGTTEATWAQDKQNLDLVSSPVQTEEITTIQGILGAIQSGALTTLVSKNLWDRLQQTGMFEYTEIPGEAKGIAGFVFGGADDSSNKAGIMIDERGRLQTYAMVEGALTAQKVSVPFTMGTGYFNNQFEDRVVRFPCAGQEDDDLSPGILLTWDSASRKYRLGVMSPFMAGNKGYPSGGINDQMNLLASFYDLGYGLNHSFDHFLTTDTASLQWGKVATIAPGSSGDGARKLSALITAGSYVAYEQSTFLLEVNGQNLIATISAGNMNRGNISQWIKFTRISDSTNAAPTMNNIPEIGVLVNTTTGNAEIWMKVPYYSPRVSVTVLSLANPAFMSVDWSDWRNNNLRTSEPSGITYAMTYYPVNNQNYVKTNSGLLVYSPNKVLRVKDAMSANSTFNRMSEFLEYGFTSYGNYHAMNKYSGAGVTVSKSATGTYSVSGCTLSASVWKVKTPVAWTDGSSAGAVAITSSSSGAFSFTLKNSAGTLIDIPDGTWIDFHVS